MYPGIVALAGFSATTPVIVDTANDAALEFGNLNPWTVPFTLAADVNKVLVFCTFQASDAPSGATVGGNACTPIVDANQENRRTSGFFIDAANLPAAGSVSAVITFAGNRRGHAIVIPLKDAVAGMPVSNTAGVNGGTTVNSSVTVTSGGAVLKGTCIDGLHFADVAEGASEDVLFEDEILSGTTELTCQFSSKSNQSGLVSMSTSWTGGADSSLVIVGVNPA